MAGFEHDGAPEARLSAALAGILEHLNVPSSAVQQSVTDVVRDVLDRRGHASIDIVGVHDGRLRLAGEPFDAKLVRYDIDAILDDLDGVSVEHIDRIVVTCGKR